MTNPKSWTSLEHDLYKLFKQEGLFESGLILAVSGGLDSMVLLHAVSRLKEKFKSQLFVAHIHHGPAKRALKLFRHKAYFFVKRQAVERGLHFLSNCRAENSKKPITKNEFQGDLTPPLNLKSEAELRDYRYHCLSHLKEKYAGGSTKLVLAHTADDLLETRLIRLIRGTGAEGLIAMQAKGEGALLRPLIQYTRQDLESYARGQRLKWLNDPTNRSMEPLRNWLRKKWLPELEKKRPGSKDCLARSLSQLAAQVDHSDLQKLIVEGAILAPEFLELNRDQQKQLLAIYLRTIGAKNYGLSHIHEILKRLDNPQKQFTFSLLKHEWIVNAQQIKARLKVMRPKA